MRENGLSHFNRTVSALWQINKSISPNRGNDSFPIVAIGVSKGGGDAALQLLEGLSARPGMAFVIIEHFSSDRKELLKELTRRTKMPVFLAADGMMPEKNHVYVISSGENMGIGNGRFILLQGAGTEDRMHPIDLFMTMLAAACREKAIGVILSGASLDGTAGACAIRTEGGFVYAQSDAELLQGMPRHAISVGYVDFILPLEHLAGGLEARKTFPPMPAIDWKKEELALIYLLLLDRGRTDFGRYDQNTVNQRIYRRMRLNGIVTLEAYSCLCEDNAAEIDMLARDLLINTTVFFREPLIFRILGKIIFPRLLKHRNAGEPLRIWIPSCSTGEDCWSLAICLLEYCRRNRKDIPLKIFATDASEVSVQVARTGIYSRSSVRNVSASRLTKYFLHSGGSYQVCRALRDICIFSRHDLLADASFSQMDIVFCNNILIESDPDRQKRVIEAFHVTLKPEGFLVPGSSEIMTAAAGLFLRVISSERIYRPHPREVDAAQTASLESELRSINDELDASREEMQSVITELTALNENLQIRNNALQEAADRRQIMPRLPI